MSLLVLLAFVGLMCGAAITDVRSYTIPNLLTISIAILYVPYALFSQASLSTIGAHIAIGAVF